MSAACTDLQDRKGISVNVLLYCVWAASAGYGRVESDELARVMAAMKSWHESVVEPLRGVRIRLKEPDLVAGHGPAVAAPAAILREDVKNAELASEHIEQNIIETTLTRAPQPVESEDGQAAQGAANVRAYFEAAGALLESADSAGLADLYRAAWPTLAPEAAAALARP